MAKIPIWPGSSSFSAGATAFGFYDGESSFQQDAPKVAKWCSQRLGYPLVDIELQDVNFFTAFEEAITEYGHQVYTYQVINNMADIIGKATSSALNYIEVERDYGMSTSGGTSLQGSGTSYNLSDKRLYSVSLSVKRGVQKYNLLSSAPQHSSASISFRPKAVNRISIRSPE